MGTVPTIAGSASDMDVVKATSTDVEQSVVPAWLAARRARVPQAKDVQTKPEAASEQESRLRSEPMVSSDATLPDAKSLDTDADSMPVLETDPPLGSFGRRKPSLRERMNECTLKGAPFWVVFGAWVTQLGQQYGSAMIGFSVSMVAHAIAVISLAVIFIGGGMDNVGLNIFGTLTNATDAEMADINLDSSLQVDAGKDAAPLVFPDLSQVVSPDAIGFETGESLQGALTGVGKGQGEGGEGEAMQVPAVNVPSYAVTKGSFSAWTDPRDPDPGRQYTIVIQVRVPSNVKKYRASDLTGMVTGTDLYKQVIKFRTTDEFPIRDGAVQIRVPVPGAAKLVRDTIRIESRLLREKQTIQIEF